MLALMFIVPAIAQAQSLRGRVTGPGNVPLAGVLVQVQQTNGQIAATTTTSENGFYSVASLADGAYNVRILRIGYRAHSAGRITIAGGAAEALNIAWDAAPIPLATRLVTAPRTCKVSADSGTLIANVWEETRKALLSSLVAEEEIKNAPDVTRLNYQRTLDSSGVVLTQLATSDQAKSFRAYSSWDPESLAVLGYVTSDGTGTSFVGPDAITLLSESFAGGHCYAVVEDTLAHPRDVGLQFTPIEDKNRKRTDIRGTFWMDRTSWNLQSIDFLYDVPSGALRDVDDRLKGGGYVEFGALKTGEWMVTNWRIRLPRVVTDRLTRAGANVTRVPVKPYVLSVQESGGMVTKVARDTTTLFASVLPSAEVKILSSDQTIDVAGAEVRVRGSQFVGKSDETGRVDLPGIFDGRYLIQARFPSFGAFGDVTTEKVITVPRGGTRDSVFIPTANTWIRAACGEKSATSALPTLYGSVRNSNGLVAGGIVTMRWEIPAPLSDDKKIKPPGVPEKHVRTVLVSETGNYVMCDVPRSGVSIRVESAAGMDQRFVRVAAEDALVELPLVATPQALSNDDSAIPAPSVVEIKVIDSNQKPVKVKLDFENAYGERGTIETDSTGRGYVLDQPTGRWIVRGKSGAFTEKQLTLGYNFIALMVTKR